MNEDPDYPKYVALVEEARPAIRQMLLLVAEHRCTVNDALDAVMDSMAGAVGLGVEMEKGRRSAHDLYGSG